MQSPPLARDFMVTGLFTVRPEAKLSKGIEILLNKGVTGVPVVDTAGRYAGMLSETPCMRSMTASPSEAATERGPSARDFMTSRLFTLQPDMDAFDGIQMLLKKRISGAPVLDDSGNFLGVFSERYSMSLLIQSAYEHWPAAHVGAYLNTDRRRLIAEEVSLQRVAELFLTNYYRRLPVLRDGKLSGQISRRDVLRAQYSAHGAPDTEVGAIMDTGAQTIHEDLDLLAIAQTFQTTNCRRLPVLRDGALVGQISRRDVLREALHLLDPKREAPSPLYLSATRSSGDRPF